MRNSYVVIMNLTTTRGFSRVYQKKLRDATTSEGLEKVGQGHPLRKLRVRLLTKSKVEVAGCTLQPEAKNFWSF